ncbi:MAG: hypothetical protein K2X81_12135 [Candidatus Obscuribacterales bacterium]|nr:hypothetical protein [Candidatus Obscuribacterales bacterium]
MRSRRNKKGQSMIEYCIGIGCVAAVCMVVMGGLGHAAADITNSVLSSINDSDDQVSDPGTIFSGGLKGTTPWVLK